MAGSFSQELEDLLNPLPKFADPEDDGDDTNKARVVDRFSEDDNDQEEDEDGVGASSSALRKNNTLLLSDTDGRYVGKKVSRQQLLMDIEGSGEDEDEDDDDDEEEEEEEDVDEEEEGSIEELEEEDDDDDDDESTGDLELDAELSSKTRGAGESDVTFPKGVDFHTLTEGMDDLGVSGEEGSESGEEEIEEGSDGDDVTDDDDDEDDDKEEQEGSVRTFSRDKVDEEVLKGKAVKSQLALWDQLLEGRIRMQKALATSNQLPQPNTLQEFKSKGGAELAGEVKNARKALKALQRSLLELHDHLLEQNPDTRAIATGQAQGEDQEIDSDDNEENMEEERVAAPKRKLEMAEYPDLMAKRFAAFQPYRNATLQKWHDKTRLTMGKSGKSFGAFDRNILTQVEQVLMDQERLLRRTQTRRSEYRVLGKPEASSALTSEAVCQEGEVEEGAEQQQQQLKANSHLKDLDQDIFDDDDFYHQLLRELIERKTSATDPNDQVAMGRQWLAIQKLRSKIKKKVDTKASKGRKVRFQIHSKLVNFMAPMDHSSMSDEARSELYRGLFGQNTTIRE